MPGSDHLAHGRPRGEKGSVEVDAQQPLPIVVREVHQRLDVLHARVAHEDVEAAKLGHRRRDGALDLVLVGHVHAHRHGPAAQFLDLVGDRLCTDVVDVGDGDARAFTREGQGELASDAARGAGDKGLQSVHSHRVRPSVCSSGHGRGAAEPPKRLAPARREAARRRLPWGQPLMLALR
jgi:hypothetical protein